MPLAFAREGLDEILLDYLSLPHYTRDLAKWEQIVNRVKNPAEEVTIAICGKYVQLGDSYKSLNEALHHGGIANGVKVRLVFVDSEELEASGFPETLVNADAILIPGGFGKRGIEGKIQAIRYAREMKVPFFGICLGMQCAVIEYARHVVRARARELHRVRSGRAAQGHLQASRPPEGGGPRRDDAARQVPVRPRGGLPRAPLLRRGRRSGSATGTGTR